MWHLISMGLTELLTVLGGLGAGVTHCLLGPDHLAAVLPFATRAKKRSPRVGLMWGLGHGASVLVLGALSQIFRSQINVESVSGFAEAMVGVLLIGLGAWTLRSTRTVVVHRHDHDHDGDAHAHPHLHVGDRTVDESEHATNGRHGHQHSALIFGGLHGLAGTSHLFGILPALLLEGVAAWLYLLAFLVGSVIAMTAFATIAGRTLGGSESRIRRGLAFSGAFSMVVGVFWLVRLA